MEISNIQSRAFSRSSGIYTIEDRVTRRRYVGSAVRLANRLAVHRHALTRGMHHSPFLQATWRKRLGSGFAFNILLVCAPEHLLFFEQRAIDSLHPEFNIARVAGSQLGLRRSETTKARMRKPHGPLSDETKRRMSEAHRGKPSPARGTKRTREQRTLQSLCRKGRKASDESRVVMAEAQRKRYAAKPMSEQTRAKIAAAARLRGNRK